MANGRLHWTFGPAPSGHRPPETSSQLRLLQHIDNLATSAESNISSNADNILKVPTPQEITRLDARCEKAMVNEVKFFIHSYEDFMTSENEKLVCYSCFKCCKCRKIQQS